MKLESIRFEKASQHDVHKPILLTFKPMVGIPHTIFSRVGHDRDALMTLN